MAIGFIGLGNLGTAVAKRLQSMNEDVLVWNRTKAKAEAKGFVCESSPKSTHRKMRYSAHVFI